MNINKENKIYLVIIGILILCVLFLSLKEYVFNNKYSFLSPNVSTIDKEDLLINFKSLENYLANKYKENDNYLVSIYFEYIPTGANFSLNKDKKIWPASLIKVPFSMAIMKKIENGILNMDDLLIIDDSNRDSKYGTLYLKPNGTEFSIKDLLRETLVNSDNTAYSMLVKKLQMKDIENIYNHLGLDEVVEFMKNVPSGEEADISITAKRYTTFFRSLYNSTYLTPENSNYFLSLLKDAPCCYLCKSIPQEIEFIHKFGIHEEKNVYTDSGIVYIPERPYLLTVMIQGKKPLSESKVNKIFEDISKTIFEFVYTAK